MPLASHLRIVVSAIPRCSAWVIPQRESPLAPCSKNDATARGKLKQPQNSPRHNHLQTRRRSMPPTPAEPATTLPRRGCRKRQQRPFLLNLFSCKGQQGHREITCDPTYASCYPNPDASHHGCRTCHGWPSTSPDRCGPGIMPERAPTTQRAGRSGYSTFQSPALLS